MAWETVSSAFEIYIPRGPVQPDHEHQAMALKTVSGGDEILFSRADWMRLVAVIKSGRLDVKSHN